jgi:hypothetical protein
MAKQSAMRVGVEEEEDEEEEEKKREEELNV